MLYTPEQLDQLLSNNYDDFAGQDKIEVFENYDGSDDELIEFFDGGNFNELTKSTKRIGIHIVNTSTTDKTIVLNPGYFRVERAAVVDSNGKYKLVDGTLVNAPSGYSTGDIIIDYTNIRPLREAGINCDAVLDDGWLLNGLFANSVAKDRPIRAFLKYIQTTPTLFAGLQIASSNPQLYENQLILKKLSPYQSKGEEIIPFQDANLPSNPNDKKIFVNRKFKLDGDTLALLTIPANTDATITLIAAAVVSNAIALEKKEKIAEQGGRFKQETAVKTPTGTVKTVSTPTVNTVSTPTVKTASTPAGAKISVPVNQKL